MHGIVSLLDAQLIGPVGHENEAYLCNVPYGLVSVSVTFTWPVAQVSESSVELLEPPALEVQDVVVAP